MSKNTIGIAAVLGLSGLLAACGGGGAPTAPTAVAPAPPAPVRSVVVQGTFTGLGPLVLGIVPPFTTSAAGTLDVQVDWTFASNDVDVYLARGSCSFEQFVSQRCDLAAFSESATAKPERLTVPNAAAGMYTLLIGNLGPGDESLSYVVGLTAGGTLSTSSARAAAGQPSRARGYVRAAR
jgi:hypothetical protein